MKNLLHGYILTTIVLSLFSCGPKIQPPKPSETIGSKGDCKLEQPTWNSVIEGFDQEKSLKILTDIKAAATANPNKIAAEGSLNANFMTAINNIIKATNQKEFKVSQEVQDLMVALRRLGCDIQAGLFTTRLDDAEKKYLDLLDKIDFTQKKISTQK